MYLVLFFYDLTMYYVSTIARSVTWAKVFDVFSPLGIEHRRVRPASRFSTLDNCVHPVAVQGPFHNKLQ